MMFSLYGGFALITFLGGVFFCAIGVVLALINNPTDLSLWGLAALFGAFVCKEGRL